MCKHGVIVMTTGKELWNHVRKEVNADAVQLSSWSSHALRTDMKHFLFTFARYKFVTKMIMNHKDLTLVELGCNDGLGTVMFEQTGICKKVIGIDFDTDSIQWAKNNVSSVITEFIEDDFLGKTYIKADVVASLDVIEHIEKDREMEFLDSICNNLKDNGVAIIGTPSLSMYQYTSEKNKEAHINNYSQTRLYELLSKRFEHVFIFGMNDEVLHVGFYPMASYIMALCCDKKLK